MRTGYSKEINQRAPSVVLFSMISAPDYPTYGQVRQIENLAPRTDRAIATNEEESS